MTALELLLHRTSQPRLESPAPAGEQLDNILKAGIRAPDHGGLTPWHFIVCQGEGLKKLGEHFERAAIASDMSARDIERAPQLPLRAPIVVIAITKYKEHPKVPWVEQVASTACAVQSMQMAAVAQGFGGMWRTGSYAQNEHLKKALGLVDEDEIVGFLYLGTPSTNSQEKPTKPLDDYVSYWS